MVLGTQTWRQYYLCRSELEFRVASGRSQDFTCKAISGHTGMSWCIVAMSTPTAHPLSGQISGVLVSQLVDWQVLLDKMWVLLGTVSSVLCHGRRNELLLPFQSRLKISNRISQTSSYNWVLLPGILTHQLAWVQATPCLFRVP